MSLTRPAREIPMAKYLIRRATFVVVALIGATVIVFAISRMGGIGDPFMYGTLCACYGVPQEYMDRIEEMAETPIAVQYLEWGGELVRGDLGITARERRSVLDAVQDRFGDSLLLAFSGWAFALTVGVPLGVLAAVNRARIWGVIGGILSMFGRGMPVFWLGIMLILAFAMIWEIFPAPALDADGFGVKVFVLPTIAVGLGIAAGYFRATRAAALDAMNSDIFGRPRAANDDEGRTRSALRKRAVRSAIVAALALSPFLLAALVNGVVAAEVVFALPGIGREAVSEAVVNDDFALLVGAVFAFTAIYLIMNFMADTLRAFADPRISYA